MRSSKTGQYNLKDKKAQLYSRVSVSTPGLMPKTYYCLLYTSDAADE